MDTGEIVKLLISVAMSDGRLDTPEQALIESICARNGVGPEKIAAWRREISVRGRGAPIPVPEDSAQRVLILRQMVQIMLADGRIEKGELDFCLVIAKRFGVPAEAVRALVRVETLGPEAPSRAPGPKTSALPGPGGRRPGLLAAAAAGVFLAAAAGAWFFWFREETAFNKLKAAPSVQACEGFLRSFPTGRHAAAAGLMKDEAAYAKARQLDSADAYEAYLGAFSSGGVHSAEAGRLAEERAYSAAAASRQLAALEEFLRRYPSGPHAREALALVDGALFAAVINSNDLGKLRGYLSRFPRSENAPAAAEALEGLAYAVAATSQDLPSLESFLREFPATPRRPQILKLIQELEFSRVMASTDPDEIGAYLKRYPAGPLAAKARERLDLLAYRRVASARDLPSLNSFLAANPGNKYALAARGLRSELWEEKIGSYAAEAPSDAGAGAVDFFKAALTQVQVTGANSVAIRFRRTVQLKDWDAFPEEIRLPIVRAYERKGDQSPARYPPDSFGRTFRGSSMKDMEGRITEKIQEALEGKFGEGVFRFDEDPGAGLVFDIRYTIGNQYQEQRGMKFPVLYTRTRSSISASTGEAVGASEFIGYMLGIEIVWDVSLRLPRTGRVHRLRQVSQAAEKFQKDAGTADSAYEDMGSQAFSRFGDDIVKHFAL